MTVGLYQKQRRDRDLLPIYVRLSHAGQTGLVSLAISCKAKDWNARRQEVRAGHPEADALNTLLGERLALARRVATEALLSEGREVSMDDVKQAVIDAVHPAREEAEEAPPIVPWMRAEVRRAFRDKGKLSTALAYGSVLANLDETLHREKLRPTQVTADRLTFALLSTHRDRLARPEDQGGAGHATNYVHKQITTIRALLARAVRASVPGAEAALRAAQLVEVKKARVERARLTLDQVHEYLGMELTGRAADVRDWFCFSFLAGGVRLGDVCRLRWTDIQRAPAGEGASPEEGRGVPVSYRMRQQKTSAVMALPLVPEAAAIVQRWEARTLDVPEERRSVYVFGLIDEADEAEPERLRRAVDRRGALARKHLAAVAKEKGWPRIGFHSARHSIADHMRRDGRSIYDISKVLGHTKISTTETYLASFDPISAGHALTGSLSRPRPKGEDDQAAAE